MAVVLRYFLAMLCTVLLRLQGLAVRMLEYESVQMGIVECKNKNDVCIKGSRLVSWVW